MLSWRISCIVLLVIFVIALLILMFARFRRNIYYKPYNDDELFKTEKQAGTKNEYYLVTSDTKKYIKRYVFRKSVYDKSVICNFNDNYAAITYYIVAYGHRNRVVEVIEVTETSTNNSSKIITLSKKTKKVNIVVKNVEGTELNTNFIKPLPKRKIRIFALFSSIALFSFLYVLRHLALELILRDYLKPYLDGIYNILGILMLVAIAIIYYFINVVSMRKRNCRNRNGGSLNYDFF